MTDIEQPPVQAPFPVAATAPSIRLRGYARNGSAQLYWSSDAPADTRFTIRRSKVKGGPYEDLQTALAGTQYRDGNLVNGTTYYYVVFVIKDATGQSNEVPVTPLSVLDRTKISPIGGSATAIVIAIAIGLAALLWAVLTGIAPAASLMWAMACLALGYFFGFLFGIPHSTSPATTSTGAAVSSPPSALAPSSNLVQVSDWLTKMVVGISLASMQTIWPFLKVVAMYVAGSRNPAANAFGMALIIFFSIIGFVYGYIQMRVTMSIEFAQADERMAEVK